MKTDHRFGISRGGDNPTDVEMLWKVKILASQCHILADDKHHPYKKPCCVGMHLVFTLAKFAPD
jgi:hypothetical protein